MNAELISRKLSISPFSSREKLIKWVEFAAEFDDLNELNLPSDDELNWFIYYSIDVIAFTAITILAIILISAIGLAKCIGLIHGLQKQSKRRNETNKKNN